MQRKKTIKVLSIVSAIGIISTVYFGVQNAKLKGLNKELSKDNQIKKAHAYKKSLDTIDSLLMDGNFTQALNLYKELNNDSIIGEYFNVDMRIEMAQKLALLPKSRPFQKLFMTGQKFDISGGSFQEVEYSKIADSQLQKAQLEIKSLRAQLSNSNDYLKFKTSKGTQLHYIGGVKNSKANGYGIAILETGSRYEGQWKDNLRHGQGKFYWNDGEIYEGEYNNDRREGYGTYYWENGEKYVGEWKQDARNGKGEFYNKRGKLKASGIWENDKLIEQN